MNIFDVMSSPEFAPRALTEGINIKPNNYGRLDDLGLFPFRGLTTTYAEVEFREGNLRLLTTKERGAPATERGRDRRYIRQLPMFHVPQTDSISADELQNALRFGDDRAVMNLMETVADKTEGMRDNHHITHEFMRWGALTGELIDADGSTLINFYEQFNITRTPIDFAFGTATTDIGAAIRGLKRRVERALKGETMSYIHVMASPEWFEAFITHPKVVEAYDKYVSEQEPLKNDVRTGFVHQGVFFEEHVGEAEFRNDDGTLISRKFIAAGEAIAFPMGTRQVFRHYGAPADRFSEVNQVGQELYMWQYPDQKGKIVELESQSNPLFVCQRPELVVPLTQS